MCDRCSVSGTQPQCEKCRALQGDAAFPYSRTDFDTSRLWSFAFDAFKREWVMLSVGVLLLFVGIFAVSFVVQIFTSIGTAVVGARNTVAVIAVTVTTSLLGQVLQAAVLGVLLMGLIRMAFDVLKGGKADLSRMFTQVPKLGAYLVQWLVVQLMVTLPFFLYMAIVLVVAVKSGGHALPDLDASPRVLIRELGELWLSVAPVLIVAWLLALVPLAWVGLPTLLVVPELVLANVSGVEAVRRAFRLASGFRLSLVGNAFLMAIAIVVGVFACCFGMLPALALAQLVLSSVYLALRNGSGLPPPNES